MQEHIKDLNLCKCRLVEKEKKTYIDVVFIVPHSDVVEKSGFI